ncbi:MAG: type II secretion system protein [Betaproteobacteria bacterium]|nr:type II secretion system protein [Betaproteobacteria bacterium]
MRSGSGERGFTYVAVLIGAATLAAALGVAAQVYSQSAQREKEAELLFVGNQYRDAITAYYERSPGGAKRYPQKLDDLLEDKRYPNVVRHLRRLYADPLTGKPLQALEAPSGGVMGVFSPSEAAPIKRAGFRPRDEALADAEKYSDWKFSYSPPGLRSSQPGNNTSGPAK